MNNPIQRWIEHFVAAYPMQRKEGYWQKPLIAYAAASDPLFQSLRQWTHPDHQLPADLLPDAVSVIAYFLPFHPSVPESNRTGRLASREWGEAYIHTNQLITDVNVYLVRRLSNAGYETVYASATHNFDEETLMSLWSHRHAAYIAGLGQFGLHNLLITEKGCCGRIGTLVTNAPVTPSPRPETPACLFKLNGSCGLCVDHCINGSLSQNGYDRHHCYAMCLENAAALSEIGLADVCGKCTVGLPCSTTNPVLLKR
ncbi:MAG: epoxyqueuosine reductase [Bacillota bacterium]|nr:epoxyqueuosine reductase [Bacillota bacterium]MDW7676133.1 epoxyqueuosine reductase [Bacillota bacterium]